MMWLADHSLRVLSVVVVVGAGSLLAWRASARSRLFTWTTVLGVAMAMPFLTGLLPTIELPLGSSAPVFVVSTPTSPAAAGIITATAETAPSRWPSPVGWLILIYVSGVVLLISRVIAGIGLTTRLVRKARSIDDDSLANEVKEQAAALRLSRTPLVKAHPSVQVPFACGLFQPTLMLPENWTSWDCTTRQAVLAHELSHISRRDLWTMHAASLYRGFTWMSPVGWWLRRRLETLADRASDAAVLASGVEPTAYAELLVRFFEQARQSPGRAHWQLAMARRGSLEARKRVGRVLSAREGGNVTFGMTARVLVGTAVTMIAVPAMVLSASQQQTIRIDVPVAVPQTVPVTPVIAVNVPQTPPTPITRLELKRIDVAPVTPTRAVEMSIVPLWRQEQDQEPEPWRSTRKATDEGMTAPVATIRVNAKYTPEAMRAKIQGQVAVELIVSPEGNVTATRVMKSLDSQLGLDEEAEKAVRQWKFLPGTFQGQPVALRVMIDMEFRLH